MTADPEGRGGLAAWNATRPPFVEADAVQRAGYLARTAGSPVYIVHTSSEEALRVARAQRRQGTRIRIETCPHYLTHDVTSPEGIVAKVNPPLRQAPDREALWTAVLSGDVDTIATDHVHRDIGSKQGNIWTASPGCPGMDTMLHVMLSEGHHKRGLSLPDIARITSANPARIMGLGQRKGAIAPGYDADFAIVDPNHVWTMERENTASGAGYSLYEGWEFTGKVIHTIVRGRPVFEDGALCPDAAGHGQFLQRTLPTATGG